MNLPHANKEDIRKKTKAFLRGRNWHKALVFFNFVVLAFIFWLTQFYQETTEVEMDIGIDYRNVPTDIVLSKAIPNKVTIKVSDKRTVLLSYNFKKRKNKININLKGLDKEQTAYHVDHSGLSTLVRSYLTGTTSLLSFYPDEFTINYLPLVGKELPVLVNGTIVPAPGFVFSDSIAITPYKVMAYSDSITLDTLYFIKTEPLFDAPVNKSQVVQAALMVPNEVKLSADAVEINVQVEEYTEKSYVIPIEAVNVPHNLHVRFFPSEVDVVCYLSIKDYSQLSEADLAIQVDYNSLSTLSSNSTPLYLTGKPSYLINYRFVPNKVDFLIEKIND